MTAEQIKSLEDLEDNQIATNKLKEYLVSRTAYLLETHNETLSELDALTEPMERRLKWNLIHELHARKSETEEALKVLNGGRSIYQ